MWSIWPSYQKLLLLSRMYRNKKSEKERCTFRGVLDSAHFHHMRKEAILLLHIQEKHLADYSKKLSIISKQSKLIHRELRDQVKTHAMYNMPRKKKSCKFSQFFFSFKKKIMQYGNDIICKARSNLLMPIQKNSRSACFFCLPQ